MKNKLTALVAQNIINAIVEQEEKRIRKAIQRKHTKKLFGMKANLTYFKKFFNIG